MKTITELANDLSISRQAIHQALDDLLDKQKIKKKGNAFILNDREQKVITDYFKHKENVASMKSSSESSTKLTISLQQQNDFLMRELESKNQQIKELHVLLLKEKGKQPLLENEEQGQNVRKGKWYDFFKRR
jgi:DNA-binding GntR family transcriptional regulator